MWENIKALFGIAVLMVIFWAVFINEPDDNRSSASTKNGNSKPVPAFNQPVQQLPQTGANTAAFGNGVAPLNIRTSSAGGQHYFVKLVKTGTNQELGSYFIRSGGVLDIKVPLGSYEIKYATGEQWYGTNYLFGPDTRFSKADSLFNFTFDGYQYSGYTVELIMHQSGNLSTSGIPASRW